jgi:hypothetical protein
MLKARMQQTSQLTNKQQSYEENTHTLSPSGIISIALITQLSRAFPPPKTPGYTLSHKLYFMSSLKQEEAEEAREKKWCAAAREVVGEEDKTAIRHRGTVGRQ